MSLKDSWDNLKLDYESNPRTNPSLYQTLLKNKYTEREINLRATGLIQGIIWGFILSSLYLKNYYVALGLWLLENIVVSKLIRWNDKETGTKKDDQPKQQD